MLMNLTRKSFIKKPKKKKYNLQMFGYIDNN